MRGLNQGLSISPREFVQRQIATTRVRSNIDDQIITNMFKEQERRELVAQLIRACTALLIVEMNEEDRQNIFEHIQIVVHRITVFLVNNQ